MNKNSKTQLIVIIGILVIINISVLIINGYKGESIFKDTFIYVIDILATIWIIKEDRKKKSCEEDSDVVLFNISRDICTMAGIPVWRGVADYQQSGIYCGQRRH